MHMTIYAGEGEEAREDATTKKKNEKVQRLSNLLEQVPGPLFPVRSVGGERVTVRSHRGRHLGLGLGLLAKQADLTPNVFVFIFCYGSSHSRCISHKSRTISSLLRSLTRSVV
ncbi:hypothetical protein PV326_002853 [Microctonus aethiopoides]|nr:hypothetical protein PV326_002853 [Microctonus aethiopoides]